MSITARSKTSDIIIVGAGLGGLAAGAYLSSHGKNVLILEQGDSLGGRCSVRKLNLGYFNIGAIHIGAGAFDSLAKLGLSFEKKAFRYKIKFPYGQVILPIEKKTIFQLMKLQITPIDIMKYMISSRNLKPYFFLRYPSLVQALDVLVPNSNLRNIFYTQASMCGIDISRLSSTLLNPESEVTSYQYDRPLSPIGGNGRLAEELMNYIEKNHGAVIHNNQVKKFHIKKGIIYKIDTENGTFSAPIVISNLDIKSTFLKLIDTSNLPSRSIEYFEMIQPSLLINSIYIKFNGTLKNTKNIASFFYSENPRAEFKLLARGKISKKPNFGLHIPTLLDDQIREQHYGTLQFYLPSISYNKSEILKISENLIQHEMYDMFPELAEQILDFEIYDPKLYYQKFGFLPHVLGMAPDYRWPRHSGHEPCIKNLFCVGDSVLPEGPSVPQVIESGFRCAEHLLSDTYRF
jgi:phytoene dehydrogenase-like protein